MAEETNNPRAADGLSPLRTYQSDVETLIKRENSSLADIAIAEAGKKAASVSPEGNRAAPIFLICSILLSAAALGALAWVYFAREAPTPNAVAKVSLPLPVDKEITIDTAGKNKEQFLRALEEGKGINLLPNSFLGFAFIKKTGENIEPVSAGDFFTIISSQAPSSLIRAFGKKLTYGFHKLEKNYPYAVLEIDDYPRASAGMLVFEKSFIRDIGSIFLEKTSVGSLSGKPFEDVVIKNKDTRALRDNSGNIVLLYSFADKQTLFIAAKGETLEELGV